jgi:hypothetical protein
VTYARCHKVFEQDAPAPMREAFEPRLRALLADLGVTSRDDLRGRGAVISEHLPQIERLADGLISTNPDIQD